MHELFLLPKVEMFSQLHLLFQSWMHQSCNTTILTLSLQFLSSSGLKKSHNLLLEIMVPVPENSINFCKISWFNIPFRCDRLTPSWIKMNPFCWLIWMILRKSGWVSSKYVPFFITQCSSDVFYLHWLWRFVLRSVSMAEIACELPFMFSSQKSPLPPQAPLHPQRCLRRHWRATFQSNLLH